MTATRVGPAAWPQRELIVVWAVGWVISFQGWGVILSFQPLIGHAITVLGWLLVPVGTYRALRSAGYQLGAGSLLVLLSAWLVGWLAIAQGYDSSSLVVRVFRDMWPWGELLARYLGPGVAGLVIGFSSSVVLLGDRLFRCLRVGLVWGLLFWVASNIAVLSVYLVGSLPQIVMGAVPRQVAALTLIGGFLGAAVGAVGNRQLRKLVPAQGPAQQVETVLDRWYRLARKRFRLAMVVVGLTALLGLGLAMYAYSRSPYRIRITVLDPNGIVAAPGSVEIEAPGDIGPNEEGSWVVVLPRGTEPADGKVVIDARNDSESLAGRGEVSLGRDRYPVVTIRLIVVDENGQAVEGAAVTEDPTGLLGAKWLMSTAEVRRLLPAADELASADRSFDTTLKLETTVFDRAASVDFFFKNDLLLRIMVSFKGDKTVERYGLTQAALESAYGKFPAPTSTEEHARLSAKSFGLTMVWHVLQEHVPREYVLMYRTEG